MRYTSEEIRAHLLGFINDTGHRDLAYVVDFCLSNYGYLSKQIWKVILKLGHEGIVTD